MNKELTRKEIPEKYRWDLKKFYKSDEAWYKDFENLKTLLPEIKKYQGKLNDKAILLDFLNFTEKIDEKMENLVMYASCSSDQDLSNSKYLEMEEQFDNLAVQFSESLAFFTPELIGYDESYLKSLIVDKDFSDYDFTFEQILREKEHTLSQIEEELLSKTGIFADDYYKMQQTYFSVDFHCPDAIDSEGKPHIVSDATYYNLLNSDDRALRLDAYTKYSSVVKDINATLSKNFIASLKKDSFYAKARKFENTLQKKLYGDNMTPDTYNRLINNAHTKLDIVGRYYKAKKSKLGLKELECCDRLCSIADNKEKFTYETSCEILKKALAPLGKEYIDMLENAINERWFDVMPNKGKRGGAYENAIYGKSPVVLLNHTDDFNSVSTMAHEFGHAMHSYYSNLAQCREKASYTIFCAEIASTTNEILLHEYFLKDTPKEKENLRLFYLDDTISTFIGTFFRQVMFAEFEEFAHSLVDNGEPISHEILNNKYNELNNQFLPNMKMNDLQQFGWVGIPHFFNQYYVWQYATGITCAINFASSILNNEPNALENYKKFLSLGGSMYPLDILKTCGIDLNTDKPYEVAFNYIEEKLNDLENIVFKNKVEEMIK